MTDGLTDWQIARMRSTNPTHTLNWAMYGPDLFVCAVEMHCNLCFRDGKPIKIVSNHYDGCPTCPTMTQDEKMKKIGPNWKAEAEKIIKLRFQREKGRKQWSQGGRKRAEDTLTYYNPYLLSYEFYISIFIYALLSDIILSQMLRINELNLCLHHIRLV